MIAITTKYHGPTNTRGSRTIATAHAGGATRRVTVAWDHTLSATANHHAAAVAWVVTHRPGLLIVAEGLGAPGTAVHLAGLAEAAGAA